jgi:hypothetical protein
MNFLISVTFSVQIFNIFTIEARLKICHCNEFINNCSYPQAANVIYALWKALVSYLELIFQN